MNEQNRDIDYSNVEIMIGEWMKIERVSWHEFTPSKNKRIWKKYAK